jgi:uncharacterized protein YqiB (DUF1249 family)
MQASFDFWYPAWSLATRPTVGGLMAICEESYRSLMQLVPELRGSHGSLSARPAVGIDLYLQVLEQSRYTTLIRLTYAFARNVGDGLNYLDPNARLCVYHDAMQVEVLDLHQTALPIYRHYGHPALDAKLKANLFLARWLAYCVRQGYRFGTGSGAGVQAIDVLSSGECQSV